MHKSNHFERPPKHKWIKVQETADSFKNYQRLFIVLKPVQQFDFLPMSISEDLPFTIRNV